MAAGYDAIVVGGGTAGCVLAARLSEDPQRRVCLVEAGPDYGPYDAGGWPEDLLDARTLALDSHRWAQSDETDPSQARARVLGGCSAHNACALVRAEPRDYDEWPEGWRAADLEPYLDRAEAQLRARRFALEELSPWHRAFLDFEGELLHHPFNVVGSTRWNAAFAYLDPARGRANLELVADTIVDRVLLENGRAAGVVTPRGELRGDLVVLAASTYGTPAILLRSGFGPRVGEDLADHVGVGVTWEATDELRAACDAFRADHQRFTGGYTVKVGDLFLFPALGPGSAVSAAVFLMKPRSRGSVRLTSAAAEAPLAVDHGFLSDARDVEQLVAGIENVRTFHTGELHPGDRDLHDYVRAEARGFFHPTGTCAWGRVTDERCRVQGIENLVVGDASLLPTPPRANTNLTVAAVAERLAEQL